jgi:hypothetical protein
MFKALPPGTLIDLEPRRIVQMQRSTNFPPIGLGGGPSVPARATIMAFALDNGWYRAYVWLGSARDAQNMAAGLLFVSEPEQVAFDSLDSLLETAREMVDQQGFELEKVELSRLNPGEQSNVLSELPLNNRTLRGRGATPDIGSSTATRRDPFVDTGLNLPNSAEQSMFPFPTARDAGMGTGHFQAAVEISREISLPAMQAVDVFARMLSLF